MVGHSSLCLRDYRLHCRPRLARGVARYFYSVVTVRSQRLANPGRPLRYHDKSILVAAAYAFAETFSWKEGLDEPFRGAIPFYAVVILSTLLGIALDVLKINPLKALFYTAVINGVLAPFLLVGILVAASDRKLMQGQPSSWPSRIMVGITTLVMFGAAAAMFIL